MENSFIIENLLKQQESVRLEFKAQPNIDAIAKAITSFVNTQGGDLVVGIADDKKVVGVENAQEQANILQSALAKTIKPTAPVSVLVINYKKKDVILISVWEGAKKPYQYKGTIYNRAGQATKAVKPEELTELISQRKQADFHWERMPVLGAELKDLDTEEIKQTIKHYKEYRKDAVISDIEDFLVQVGLIQNGNITNACMVLFGKNPIRFIPQSRIRLTLYPSKTSGNQFIDDKMFEGNIFKNITAILEYLDIIYGKTLKVEGVLRTDKPNYPVLALREGLLNAIVHRDYNSVKGFLQISIYSDRTEISNYGTLPDGITIADLKKEHSSILRNPDIAQMCFYRRYIEMLGSGTQRMIRDCKENKFKIPVWKQTEHTTTVTFPDVTHHRKSDAVNDGVSDAVNDVVNNSVADSVTEPVRERLAGILQMLYDTVGVKVADLVVKFDVSERTIKENLKTLTDAGLIEYIGSKKVGNYQLTKKMHDNLHDNLHDKTKKKQ